MRSQGLTHYAWLDVGQERYFASGPIEPFLCRGDSAIVRLIQGIWDEVPDQARKILRSRIFTTANQLSEMDFGMIKVAAKRVQLGCGLAEFEAGLGEMRPKAFFARSQQNVKIFDPTEDPLRFDSDQEAMVYALRLAQGIQTHEIRYKSYRPIAAILVSPEGRLCAAAANTSVPNRTQHAEVNLVQGYCSYSERNLPLGSKIYTTLKPCKMCAGMIWSASESPLDLTVFYLENDPGPYAQQTVFTPQSFERRRAQLAHAQSFSHDCEFQVLLEP